MKYVMSQGKQTQKAYLREERDQDGVPLSHQKLKDFLKEQNRNLTDYIKESVEHEKEDSDSEEMDTEEYEDISTDEEDMDIVLNNCELLESDVEEVEIESESDEDVDSFNI